MPTSSDSIAHLAGALAKAQIELVNPAKTRTGVVNRGRSGGGGETFRYAPLSVGLDIVRKTLGRHDIAVVQGTEMDRDSGTVVLITTLAHGSGEWIAGSWPVCRISDLSHPKLMGAALTYARRYSLFALVGLAGEDDLDAPDFVSPEEDQCGADAALERPETDDAAPASLSHTAAGESAPFSKRLSQAPSMRTSAVKHRSVRAVEVNNRSSRERARTRVGETGHDEATSLTGTTDALAQVAHVDDLLAWAISALPFRATPDEGQRAALDAAFVARAEEIGVDRELLIAFGGPPSMTEPQELKAAPQRCEENHESQAAP